jgi:ABC-type glutathione transport system ATPase component
MPSEAERADSLLSVDGLCVTAPGAVDVVRGVSFALQRDQTLGLVGESGSGKTLTCRAVLGALPAGCAATGGTIEFEGHDLRGLDERGWEQLRGAHIGAVFQDPASYLNPSLTVGHQLAEVLRVRGGHNRRAARQRALELLALMGLNRVEAVYRQVPSQLSGGMQQRVMLAIAISCDPALLVADEPTTALDVKTQRDVLVLLRSLRQRFGLSILFVSHDLEVVAELCDRIAVFYRGEIVEAGSTDRIINDPTHPYTRHLLSAANGTHTPDGLPASLEETQSVI